MATLLHAVDENFGQCSATASLGFLNVHHAVVGDRVVHIHTRTTLILSETGWVGTDTRCFERKKNKKGCGTNL